MEKLERKQFRKDINRIAGGLCLYMIVMIVCVIGGMIIGMFQITLNSTQPNLLDQEIENYLMQATNSGFSSIVGILSGVLILFIYFRNSGLIHLLIDSNKQMNKHVFLEILIVLLSTQLVFNVGGEGIERLLNQFGFSIMEQIESATAGSTSVSMFLYASFLGPITEEIVFRGFILRSLAKYGRHFAIVTSAIMFGLFHANFIQGIFAFFVGLILGYVAMEYSIKWSIAFHIFNNFIFGDVLFFILENFESTSAMIAISVLDLVFFVGGIYIICFKRKKEVHQYLQLKKTNRELYIQAFTTIWMLLFMTAEIIMSFLGITKL